MKLTSKIRHLGVIFEQLKKNGTKKCSEEATWM